MDSEHTLFDNRKAGKLTPIIPNADYGRPECHGVSYLQVLLELSSTVEQGELSRLPEELQSRKPVLRSSVKRGYMELGGFRTSKL